MFLSKNKFTHGIGQISKIFGYSLIWIDN